MINKTAVVSSNVDSAGHDGNETMEVTFRSGDTYRAAGVPKSAYDDFMASKSKGKYFNAVLKYAYAWKKVS